LFSFLKFLRFEYGNEQVDDQCQREKSGDDLHYFETSSKNLPKHKQQHKNPTIKMI